MAKHHDRRAAKSHKRSRRSSTNHIRKQRHINRDRSFVVGVEDGAPDDQLNPARGPDCWHTVGLVVASNTDQIDAFCKDIELHAGHPAFVLKKWNGGNSRNRLPNQLSFVRGFTAAMKIHKSVRVWVYAMQAKEIEKLWTRFLLGLQNSDTVKIVTRRDGKNVVKWGPFGVKKNNVGIFINFEMDIKRASVIVWTATALQDLYQEVTKSIGHKPIMDVLCDRLPSDPSANGLAVIIRLLRKMVKDRITLHTQHPSEHRADIHAELLADCVATWGRDYLETPSRATSIELTRLLADPELTDRFSVKIRYLDRPEKKTAAGVDPPLS
jgi:hypothetical protein